jgi:hypothetical protein
MGIAYFSDSLCSKPIAYVMSGCPTPTYAYQYASTTCSTITYRIFPIVGAYTGPAYSDTAGTCSPDTSSTAMTFYTIGSETPPSAYVAATVQTDQ